MRHNSSHQIKDLDAPASQYLRRDGLAFDFGEGEQTGYSIAIGSGADDALSGAASRDYLWGMAGNDRLLGGQDDDHLFGNSGHDLLSGGAAGDRLVGGPGADRLYGGVGADALMGGSGNDLLDEGDGHGDLDGGTGDDILIGGKGADAFMISRDSGHDVIRDFTAGPGIFDHLAVMGMRWSELSFAQLPQGVRISWDGGSVILEAVHLSALAQDDFMFSDIAELPPATRAPAGPTPERSSPSVPGPEPAAVAMRGAQFNELADAHLHTGKGLSFSFVADHGYSITVGSIHDDALNGTERADMQFGRRGDDRLLGMAGDDILQGDAGKDWLDGADGRDKLDGGAGDDVLFGGAGEDGLKGGDGNDRIDAGNGHDMIDGGAGNDRLWGGNGADAFMVMPDSGHDIVVDFQARGAAQGAYDHIAFIDILPEQVRIQDSTDGVLISWDTDQDGVANGSVLLRGLSSADLRQNDFMFNEAPAFVAGISTIGSYYIFA